MSPERNLLFGLLALHNGFVTRDQLVAAFGSWTADKRRRLDQIFKDHGALDDSKLQLLSALVECHLSMHGGDPAQSLAKLSSIGPSARHDLEQLNDDQLKTCLSQLPPVEPQGGGEFLSTIVKDVGRPSTGGRFIVLRPHARGGLGQVAVALDKELHREVALKEIRPERAEEKSVRTRFIREAEITGGLEHPGIVPVYGLGTYGDGRPYYAMKFVRGRSLKTALEEFHQKHSHPHTSDYQGIEFRQLLQRFLDVCNAMQYAHDRGVLHRDLKPGNIMLGQYGETLVIDWGLAKPQGESEKDFLSTLSREKPLVPQSSGSESGDETQPGSAIGTPQYMSPEQAAGRLEELGPTTDVYALGATLYHLLTGRPPFDRKQGENFGDLLNRVQRGDYPLPRSVKPQIPKVLEAIVLKAMSLRIASRYDMPRDLAADLEHWLADEPVSVVAETAVDKMSRVGRKHRGVVATVLAASLLIAIGSSIAAIVINEQRQANATLAQKNAGLAIEQSKLAETNSKIASEQTAERAKAELLAQEKSDLAASNASLAEVAAERAKQLEVQSDDLARQLAIAQLARASAELDVHNHKAAERLLTSIPLNQRGWEYRYLWRKCEGTPLTLRGHQSYIHTVACSADGRLLATGAIRRPESDGWDIIIWDTTTGKEIRKLRDPSGYISSLAFSPDGTKIVSGGGKTVKLWDLKHESEVLTLGGHAESITVVAFCPTGMRVASGSNDKTVKVWDVATGNEFFTLEGYAESVRAIAFSPDGRRIATVAGGHAADDGWNIKVSDTATGEERLKLRDPWGHVASVAFSPDGTELLTGSHNHYLRLWNSTTGEELFALDSKKYGILSVAYSPDGQLFAAGMQDDNVHLWDRATRKELRVFRGHADAVMSIAFVADGTRLASTSLDQTVKIWNVASEADPEEFVERSCDKIAYSADGQRLAGIIRDTVGICDVPTKQVLRMLRGHQGGVTSIAFSPDGTQLASSSHDKTIKLWDASTGIERQTLLGHIKPVFCVAFSPDGKWLASAADDGTIKAWDAKTGREQYTIGKQLDGYAYRRAVAFSPDSTILASGSDGGTIKLSNAITGTELFNLQESPKQTVIMVLAFSPDGSRLASASSGSIIQIWDTTTGAEVWTSREHTQSVHSLAFSPDGSRLASVGEHVKIWDPVTGAQMLSIGEPLVVGVNSLTFSPDGAFLAVAQLGRILRVKLLHGMAETDVLNLRRHDEYIVSLRFSADGTRLVSRDLNGASRIWRLPDGELLPEDAMPDEKQLMDQSPDPLITAIARYSDISVVRKNPKYDPWKEDAEARKKSSPKWHEAEALKAEQSQTWFSAAFHLGRLLRDQPDDADLKSRYAAAVAKLKEQNIEPPKIPERSATPGDQGK